MPLTLPAISVLGVVLPERREGETAIAAATRLVITEALCVTSGKQNEAARLLATTPRVICYYVRLWNLLPKRGNGGKRRCVPY